MATLVQRGDSLECPNCNIALDPQAEPVQGHEPTLIDTTHPPRLAGQNTLRSRLAGVTWLVFTMLFVTGGAATAAYFVLGAPSDPTRPLSAIQSLDENDIFLAGDFAADWPLSAWSWPAQRVVVSGNAADGGLLTIVETSIQGPVSPQYDAVEFGPNGRLRMHYPLGRLQDGDLHAAAGRLGDQLFFAFRQADSVSIVSRAADGSMAWRRDFPVFQDTVMEPQLSAADAALLALLPSERADEISAIMIGADGFPDWQRQIDIVTATRPFLAATAFDEFAIAITAEKDEVRSAQVLLLNRAGQIVLDQHIAMGPDEQLIDMAAPKSGGIALLIAGDNLRTVQLDSLGRDESAFEVSTKLTEQVTAGCKLLLDHGGQVTVCARGKQLLFWDMATSQIGPDTPHIIDVKATVDAPIINISEDRFLLISNVSATPDRSWVAAVPRAVWRKPQPGPLQANSTDKRLASTETVEPGEDTREQQAFQDIVIDDQSPAAAAQRVGAQRKPAKSAHVDCEITCSAAEAPRAKYPVPFSTKLVAGRTLEDIESDLAASYEGICAESGGIPTLSRSVQCAIRN